MTHDSSPPKKMEMPGQDKATGSSGYSQDEAGVSAARGPREKQKTPDSSYQSYLFGNAGANDTPAWSDSARGRFFIRLISRGVVGATFFVVGSRMAATQMTGYSHEAPWNWKKPLQIIAKGFDVTLGKGIQKSVEGLAGFKHGFGSQMAKDIGKNAVTFRESREFPGSRLERGRTYGSDIVNFTFDFAMASIGDAATRNIIQGIDPNIKKKWLVNDDGNPASRGERKHFLPGEWLKSVGKSAWYVMTKNQGEDWAAAIPYAFQMKFQRQFLSNIFNKRWEGHKLVFDRQWNGGAYRINQQGQIVGDYQLVGAIDLHARFVGYNWYTLMFREGYDAIGQAWHKWKDDGFKLSVPLPEHFNPITTPLDGLGHAARYVTKSFIKANMYMNPAVIPFWLMRVPQSKWRGKFFVEEGMTEFNPQTAKRTHIWESGGFDPYASSNFDHYPTKTAFDKIEKGVSKHLFNPIGWVSFNAGTKMANLFESAHHRGWTPKSTFVRNILQGGKDEESFIQGGRRFAHEVVDASFAYTPYMYAKQEFGLRVDDNKGDGKPGQMDLAIYKFMDDVAGLKFREVPYDLKKMWKLGMNFEREIKAREGAGADEQNIAKAPIKPKHPATTVQASGLERGETVSVDHRGRGESANDVDYAHDQRWVKSVVGSDINPARIHSASTTRH